MTKIPKAEQKLLYLHPDTSVLENDFIAAEKNGTAAIWDQYNKLLKVYGANWEILTALVNAAEHRLYFYLHYQPDEEEIISIYWSMPDMINQFARIHLKQEEDYRAFCNANHYSEANYLICDGI